MHEPDSTGKIDPYDYIRDLSPVESARFKFDEEEYTMLCLFKNDLLHKNLLREQQFYEHVNTILPVRIGEYIYYRKPNNSADLLSLYRFPIDELEKAGFTEG